MEIEINLYLEINLILLLFVITCQSKLGCTKQWAGFTVLKYAVKFAFSQFLFVFDIKKCCFIIFAHKEVNKEFRHMNQFEIYCVTLPWVHKVNRTEGASDQFPMWIFNFWPYGQLRVVRGKIQLHMNYVQLLSSTFSCFLDHQNNFGNKIPFLIKQN